MGHGTRRGLRGGGRGDGSGAAAVTAAVAAGCAMAVLAAGPSWALRRPDPRPAVQIAALSPVAVPSRSRLEVIRLDPDPAPPGGRTIVHGFVANEGPDTTASPITVLFTMPDGVTPQGPFYPEDCQVLQQGRQVRCVFEPGLREGRSATALVPVRLSRDLREGVLRGGSVALSSPDDPVMRDHRQPFEIKVSEEAVGNP